MSGSKTRNLWYLTGGSPLCIVCRQGGDGQSATSGLPTIRSSWARISSLAGGVSEAPIWRMSVAVLTSQPGERPNPSMMATLALKSNSLARPLDQKMRVSSTRASRSKARASNMLAMMLGVLTVSVST
ncbi:hypothetical protein AC244_26735 [Ensifer adhaerens]|uniref:Uncharacterized protein n=1 Tax=Ensifer adhaerens TaxID=106592 RepID=A0A0L8BIP0_ENSAD|nr:hypothetical protein AC244_26735 [Ensifer adhaerens]